jgi:carbon-monoxide dehydrogenase medium subunit
MIPQTFEYTAPKTLEEALQIIAGGGKPLSGGMSLIPMMKLRLAAPDHLVDLGRLKDLHYIREEGGALHIGATTTHQDVASSALVRGKCPLLAQTAGGVGDPQVRNRGTIGGSVAHADPSADYPAAMQALEAKFVLKGAKSERTVAAADFFLDTFLTALEPGEIVREVIVPVEDGSTGTHYEKVVQKASGFAVVGIAVRISRKAGKIVWARVGVTGLANHAYRATAVEKGLAGTSGGATEVQNAAAVVADGIEANSDLHASAEYRKHLAVVHTIRALLAALARTA